MKRTSYKRRNAFAFSRRALVGVFGIAVLLIILLLRFFAPGTFITLMSPFWSAGTSASEGSSSFFAGFRNARALAGEVQNLSQENAVLTSQNTALSAKVADLEKLVGTEPSKMNGIIAGVLARPPEAPYDTYVLAAGSTSGVEVGDVAFTNGGVPLGAVSGVSATASRVTLLSASGEVVDAWVGASRTAITLRGQGGGTFSSTISREVTVNVGDAVYVSGPGALPIGTVSAVNSDPSSPLVTLAISPAVNIFSVPWVLLVHQGPSTWPAGAPTATSTLP